MPVNARRILIRLFLITFFLLSFGQGFAQAITSDDLQSILNNTPNYGQDENGGSACGGDNSSGGTTDLPGGDNKQKVFNYFLDKGLSDVQAAAITGNFIVESSLNTSADQPGGPGMGIAQWGNPGRWNNLEKFAAQKGGDKFDLGTQLDFVWAELNGTPPAGDYSGVLKKLQSQTDITDATGFFMGTSTYGTSLWQPTPDDQAARDFVAKYGSVPGYEDPGVPHFNDRLKAAKGILGQYGGSSSGAVSGADSNCNSVGAVNCSSAPQDSAASGSGASSGSLSQVRQNVVCVAKAEYAQWKSGQLGPGTDFYKYSQGRNEEWCADFASWVFNQAGYPLSTASKGGNVAAVQSVRDIGEAGSRFVWHSAGSYTPQPGDIVVYQDGESHVNIVVSVNTNSSSMTVIGGNQDGSTTANTSSKVSEYPLDGFTGNHITGYVSPKE